tara:strand:- start:188 stop:1084 length:897 start_codon:yes stop_codon:yes gene_type:complete
MKDKTLVNINGQILSPEQANVSVFDRGFLYGDSIYEVTMTLDNVPFMVEDHMDRLEKSANKIGLPLPFPRGEIVKQLISTVKSLGVKKSYVRIVCTRGAGEITLDPTKEQTGNFILICKELHPNPEQWYSKGVWMVIADVVKKHQRATDPSVKSGNYLNNVMAMAEAKQAGAFDAIMLNHQGMVSEGTTSNIWMVKDGKFITPPLDAGLLGGITRKSLLDLGQNQGLKMSEANFSPEQMKAADEVFLTSTTKEIVPIVKIDDQIIGSGQPGVNTRKLHAMYQDLMAEHYKSEKSRLNI